jgi:SAM-dependent methyltransferase
MLHRRANPNEIAPPHSPAADRNKGPLLDILRQALPASGVVLEIASGTGQHAAHFAEHLADLEWQPSDFNADCLPWIAAQTEALTNVRPPLHLDVCAAPWPLDRADAVLCINMIHISPPESTIGLLTGAARILHSGAPLVTYGPYRRHGEHTAPSNADFDQHLKRQNPSWGVRDLETVAELATTLGFTLESVHEMPANNLSVVFRRI